MKDSRLAEIGTAQEKEWLKTQTDDINRSDMDMVTLPSGQTYFVYLVLVALRVSYSTSQS
jgi:hypothetical protein